MNDHKLFIFIICLFIIRGFIVDRYYSISTRNEYNKKLCGFNSFPALDGSGSCNCYDGKYKFFDNRYNPENNNDNH